MKKNIILVLLSFIMMFFVTSPNQMTYAVNIKDNAVIIIDGEINEQGELVIYADLVSNTGISAMTLELVYNDSVMTLSNVERGDALVSLDFLTTKADTELGYSITPFVFNYFNLKDKNDYSNGRLFSLTFKLNSKIKNGNYNVSLKYKKDADVNYIDEYGDIKTKNLYIDSAKIQIRNNSVIKIESFSEEKSNNWIIILYISAGVVAVGTAITVIILLKKRRNWKRL